MRFTSLFLLGSFAVASFTFAPRADACGGCVYPPPVAVDAGGPQTGTVVTDHRMVLAIDKDYTTLWDQIEYAGNPDEFAWILPVRGAVTVGIGSNQFIDQLDQKTAPIIRAPELECQLPGGGGGGGSNSSGCICIGFGSATSADYAAAPGEGHLIDGGVADDGVVVKDRAVVGPYESVQIASTSSESIPTWLSKNKFYVPPDIEPIISAYVKEGFDFVAIRLRPGVGVQAMRPIRVSWNGRSPTLPLRMVSAGVAKSVGIKLFVIGDGRWKTQNFPSFVIIENDLVWDFKESRSNYTLLRSQTSAGLDDKAFALEASIGMYGVEFAGIPPGEGAITPPPDAPKIASTISDRDLAFPSTAERRVTRLRGDIAARHLNADLVLQADVDLTERKPEYVAKGYRNTDGLCPGGYLYSPTGAQPKSLDGKAIPSAPGNLLKQGESSACTVPPIADDRQETDGSRYRLPIAMSALLALAQWVRRARSRRPARTDRT